MNKKIMIIFTSMLILISSLGTTFAANIKETTGLKVYFLPVGKADSIVISCNGKIALIDGGKTKTKGGNFKTGDVDGYEVTSKFLKETLKVDTINYLIGTHTHPDHIGAWIDFADEGKSGITVENVYVSQYAKYEKNYDKRVKVFPDSKINELKAGDTIDIGGATLEVLAPWNDAKMTKKIMQTKEDGLLENEYSLITKLTYGDHSFLFMADAIQKTNSKYTMLSNTTTYKKGDKDRTMSGWLRATYGERLAVDVVKLPHHGFNELPQSTIDLILPKKSAEKQYVVITCDKDEASVLNNNPKNKLSKLESRLRWVVTKLMSTRPKVNYVYPSLKNTKYIMFEGKLNDTNLTYTRIK